MRDDRRGTTERISYTIQYILRRSGTRHAVMLGRAEGKRTHAARTSALSPVRPELSRTRAGRGSREATEVHRSSFARTARERDEAVVTWALAGMVFITQGVARPRATGFVGAGSARQRP